VVSRTLKDPTWPNTTVLRGAPTGKTAKLKQLRLVQATPFRSGIVLLTYRTS
jgi:hypothetical protein